jgi:CheY-like chemotaxis protein
MNQSILVADDEETIRQSVRRCLEHAGFDVCEAANGAEVAAACQAAPFDLAVIDVFMPQKDGLEAIMSLRKQQPDVKIIAMSGAPEDVFLDSAAGLGASRVLRKPFRPAELLDIVRDLLGVTAN